MDNLTTGIVAFSNVEECDVYMGKSTGRYSLVITIDEAEASRMTDMGIKVKEYEGTKQRKFSSNYKPSVVDLEDNPVHGEIPYGSEVRIAWAAGPNNPQYGVPCYMNKVRLVERTQGGETPEEF